MANRTFYEMQALDKEVKVLFGKIAIGASGAVESGQTSNGFTVTRSSAGVYLCTLADQYNELLFADATLFDPSGADLMIQMSAYDMTAKTVTFRCTITGVTSTATDPATDNEIFFMIALKNTSQVP